MINTEQVRVIITF